MPSNKSQAQALKSLLSLEVGQLYRLKDIGTARSWDYSLPTISSHRSFTERLNFKSDESFFDMLKKDVNGGLPYQILEDAGVFEKGSDLVLFGGCLLDIVLNRKDGINDFDLRLVGERYMGDEAKCVERAKAFVSSVFSTLSSRNENVDEQRKIAKEEGRHYYESKCNLQDIVVSRSRSTVTVHIPAFGDKRACVFQLTFAPVKSVQDMLSACQPHCTRLAVKDGEVVLDHMARYCIESTCVVIDANAMKDYYCGDSGDVDEEARRVTTGRTLAGQMSRYIKYWEDKGFDIILPGLDVSKVPRRNLAYDVVEVLALPSMIVVYDAVDKQQIMTTRIDLPKDLKKKVPSAGLIGSYDSQPAPNVGEVIHWNIRCLANEVYDSFKYVANGERWDHVFDFVPELTPRSVRKSFETVMEDLKSGAIPVYRITGYFSVTSPSDVVDRLIAKPLRESICRKGALPRPFAVDHDDLKELAEDEIASIIKKIEGLRESMKEKGLDTLISPFPQSVSTRDEVFDAIYGSNGLKPDAEG